MRLKVTINADRLTLPINYQSILQGFIYNIFDNNEYGKFLHDKGYREGKKVFKLFAFSNLFGNYEIENYKIHFSGDMHFYIGSYSEEFMKIVYEFIVNNSYLSLQKQIVRVKNIEISDLPYFKGTKEVIIRSLSPIVAYRTIGKYVNYYKPSSKEFSEICITNLDEKNKSMGSPISGISFELIEVLKEKKRIVKFKNTFYEGYLAEMRIRVNYETLQLIYDTGLSSKGSAGFGMIETTK